MLTTRTTRRWLMMTTPNMSIEPRMAVEPKLLYRVVLGSDTNVHVVVSVPWVQNRARC